MRPLRIAHPWLLACLVLAAPAASVAGPPGSSVAPAPDGSLPAPSAKTAFMVIANGDGTEAKAKKQLAQYNASNYPAYGRYPRVVHSDDVTGLKPGFWIVVSTVCTRKSVADALAQYLRQHGMGAYVRAVEYEGADDLRLIRITPKQVVFDEEVIDRIQLEWTVYLSRSVSVKAKSLPDGSAIIPTVGPVPSELASVSVEIPLNHFNAKLRGPGMCGYYDSSPEYDPRLVEAPDGVFSVQLDKVTLAEGACSD